MYEVTCFPHFRENDVKDMAAEKQGRCPCSIEKGAEVPFS